MVVEVAPRIPFRDTSYNDQMDSEDALLMLDTMYRSYGLTADDDKIAFREALYKYVFINGTSDRANFEGTITVSGERIRLKTIAPLIHGKSRKFFRRLQYDAHDYLTHSSCLLLRLELAQKYREITGEQDAPCAIDFFKEVLSTDQARLAELIKRRRLNNSWSQRSQSTSRRQIPPEFVAEPPPQDNAGGYFRDNY